MAAGKNVNENQLDNGVLSENDAPDRVARPGDLLPDVIGAGHNAMLGMVVHTLKNLRYDSCGLGSAVSNPEYMPMQSGDTTLGKGKHHKSKHRATRLRGAAALAAIRSNILSALRSPAHARI